MCLNRCLDLDGGSHPSLLRAVLLLVQVAACGCYEIRPELPENYIGSPARPGWPPLPVYSLDPFHPANRLFQRLFVFGDEGTFVMDGAERPSSPEGRLAQAEIGDVPFSRRERLSAADRAEVHALLEVLSDGSGGDSYPEDPIRRAILQSDLLAVACRLDPAGEVEKELARAALRLAPEEVPAPSDRWVLPPPLREPGWRELAGPRRSGLSPSPADLRWTRIFRRSLAPDAREGRGQSPAGSNQQIIAESALLRLRIGVHSDGEPILLSLGSEAWFLRPGNTGAPTSRIVRFRRTKLIRDGDAWEEVPAEEVIALRDPEDPRRPSLTGKASSICSSCHQGPSLAPRPPAEKSQEGDVPLTRERQLQDARRALGLLFLKSES